jgi:hypothetical protein
MRPAGNRIIEEKYGLGMELPRDMKISHIMVNYQVFLSSTWCGTGEES